jgi:hypothetical protein
LAQPQAYPGLLEVCLNGSVEQTHVPEQIKHLVHRPLLYGSQEGFYLFLCNQTEKKENKSAISQII